MKRKNHYELRAGVFVLVAVLVFTAGVFLLGKKSALFVPTTNLFVRFKDINGLVVGSPVRLAGLEIGAVSAISFPADLHKKEAMVRLSVRSAYMGRIRADSVAIIDSNGLLGDKIVNISLGDPSAGTLKDGATLATGETLTFERLSETLHEAIASAKGVTDEAQLFLRTMRERDVQGDVSRITSSMANVLAKIESGDGVAHRLIYEQRDAEELKAALADLRSTATKANRAMGAVESIVTEVERGDGSLHALVYGDDAKKTVAELAVASQEIASVAREIREGNGLVHTLIYDDGSAKIVADLEQLSATLNRIVQDVDKGRGTLGGLVRDPTVYEDLKSSLATVERNLLFKALVRFTIEQEKLRRVDDASTVQRPASREPSPPAQDAHESAASRVSNHSVPEP